MEQDLERLSNLSTKIEGWFGISLYEIAQWDQTTLIIIGTSIVVFEIVFIIFWSERRKKRKSGHRGLMQQLKNEDPYTKLNLPPKDL